MSNALTHAQKEIDLLLKYFDNTDDLPIIKDFIPEILALVEKFGESGQSGGSAPYVAAAIANAVKKLCLFETITPITGDESEWVDVSNGLFQNNRCYALFKENDKCYYLDAIAWKNQNDATWSGTATLNTGEIITSRQNIKSFPFTPKTFIIDITDKEIEKDDWEFYINDDVQLKEVFDYYDKREYIGKEKN